MKRIPISKITPEQIRAEVEKWGFRYQYQKPIGYIKIPMSHSVFALRGFDSNRMAIIAYGRSRESAHRNLIRLFRHEMKRICEKGKEMEK